MEIEELTKKLDENSRKINDNIKNIENNFNQMQQNSYALDILKDYKNESKKLFIILIIVLSMWFVTIGYLVYVLNDIGVVEETTQEITDFDTINGDVVNKGDINGED